MVKRLLLNSGKGGVVLKMGGLILKFMVRTWGMLFAILPSRLYEATMRVLGLVLFVASLKERRNLFRNVQEVYGLPQHSYFAKLFARQVFSHYAAVFMDVCIFFAKPRAIRFQNMNELSDTIASMRLNSQDGTETGFVVITAHLGNWEFCAHVVKRVTDSNFYVLAKPTRYEGVNDLLESLRQNMGVKVLWNNRKSLVRDILKAVRHRQAVGFVMDQKPEKRQGIEVGFFDRPTAFVSGPATFAVRESLPVIGVFCMRVAPKTYRIHYQVLCNREDYQNGSLSSFDGAPDAETQITQKFASHIEETIRVYPEQWAWTYKRWRFHE